MENVVQHPLAAELTRKNEWADRLAEEKAERAAHRKWLKETKPERDAERALSKRMETARYEINHGAYEVSEYLDLKFQTENPHVPASDSPRWWTNFLPILESLVATAQAAAAKHAGFDSWQAFKDAAAELEGKYYSDEEAA